MNAAVHYNLRERQAYENIKVDFQEDARALSSKKPASPKLEIQTLENNNLEKERREVDPCDARRMWQEN